MPELKGLLSHEPPTDEPTVESLQREIHGLKKQRDELRRVVRRVTKELQAATRLDPLTATLDRANFVTQMKTALTASRRDQHPVSILVVDIDGLGEINARHDDDVGNLVLQMVAARIASVSRSQDLVGRIDGGRFAIVLVKTAPDSAVVAARRIQAALNAAPVVTAVGEELEVTVSVGVAGVASVDSPKAVESLVRRALSNLEDAKTEGPAGLVWS